MGSKKKNLQLTSSAQERAAPPPPRPSSSAVGGLLPAAPHESFSSPGPLCCLPRGPSTRVAARWRSPRLDGGTPVWRPSDTSSQVPCVDASRAHLLHVPEGISTTGGEQRGGAASPISVKSPAGFSPSSPPPLPLGVTAWVVPMVCTTVPLLLHSPVVVLSPPHMPPTAQVRSTVAALRCRQGHVPPEMPSAWRYSTTTPRGLRRESGWRRCRRHGGRMTSRERLGRRQPRRPRFQRLRGSLRREDFDLRRCVLGSTATTRRVLWPPARL